MDLEETAIPEWYMVVVGHLGGEGDQAYKYHIAGEYSVASVNFAIDGIKHRLITTE